MSSACWRENRKMWLSLVANGWPLVSQAYGGATIPVKGVLNAQVALREQPQQLTLLVTDLEQGSNFMGLDWLDAFGRRLSGSDSVCFVEEQGVNTVIKHIVGKYEAVFRLNLAHLVLKPNAQSKIFKPRPLPFALMDAVKG
ncbi:hypothetical protein D918_06576 [Trichuris suis]|nr:hypothetical protein D918_06576 [Trichuris suis]